MYQKRPSAPPDTPWKIFSISLIKFWAPSGLYPPLKTSGLFHWKHSNPWYSTTSRASPLFWFPTTWAKAWRAYFIAWSFRPTITPYEHQEIRTWKEYKKKNKTKSHHLKSLLSYSWESIPQENTPLKQSSLDTLTLFFHPLYSWPLAMSSHCTSQII